MVKDDPNVRASWSRARLLLRSGALLLGLGLALPVGLSAQIYNVRHYTNRDGLPQRQIRALHQGHGGYIWFGTFGGLSRFSGATIHTYSIDDGLSSNVVEEIAEDERGRFYLATWDGGLCIMEAGAFRCLSEEDGLAANDLHDIQAGADGSIWIATGGGLSRLKNGTFTNYGPEDGLPSESVLSLADDGRGGLWIGTRAGLARFRRDGITAVHPDELSDEAVAMLLPVPRGLLVGTDATLRLLTDTVLTTLAVEGLQPNASFNDAARDSTGVVWIGTSDGLLRWDGSSFLRLTEANGLLRNRITRVMVDREGNVWLGSDAGASKLVPGPFKAYSMTEGLPNPFARTLAEDAEGRLWVGTRYGAAVRVGDRFVESVAGEELEDGRVYSLAPTPDGGMLLGTGKGLVYWNGRVVRTYLESDGLPGNLVPSLLPDPSGGVWVGTEGGVTRWREGRLAPLPEEHPLSGLFAVSMAYDPEGRLWLGLRSGGVRIWDGHEARILDGSMGLTDQAVWTLDADSAGRMWVGTNGDGAFWVDGDEIHSLTSREGLVNDFVWQILADSRGSIWLYTNRGLDRYRNGSFDHFGLGDGLTDLEGAASAALEDSEGNLWFGTSSGVLAYEPQQARHNSVRPPVRIEEVRLGADPLASGARIRFESELLSLRFAALSFRDEDAVRYRYRLVQGDEDDQAWSHAVRERTVTLAGLGPGRYTFEVVGINNDGLASETPATFSFTVLPAVWQTWWFWLLAAAALAGVASGVPVIRARRIEAERARLEEEVAAHTRDLEDANERLRDEIRERERFQAALQRSENRLREIVENSTNVFYSHTPEHELTYLSPQTRDLLGMEPEEALIRWTELATDHPANDAGYAATVRAIETGERQPPYELELRHADGSSVWVRVTESPVVRDGRTVAVVGALTDITDARRAEDERRRLEEQLHQAQKMEAVGRLAGGVAHDFNNLLTSILGHADLVAAELGADHDLLPELDEVKDACDRAASLVDQLLAFGRKQVVKPTHLDLNRVVENGVQMLGRVLGEDVELVTRLSPRRPWIHMDEGQLNQVLVNLAVNARDAMPGGGTLTISTEREALDSLPDAWGDVEFVSGEYAVLRVSDTGSGMDPVTAERVFEPFFTTKEVGKGPGLGLATVYGIVKQNSGYIWMDTAVGTGTSFTLYLPESDSPEATDQNDERSTLGNGHEKPSETVLVVEDEDAVRTLVSRVLEKEGYTVYQATDGAQALEIVRTRSGPIDLLVTDMIMPGMTGKAVAEAITARHRETRVLFISGYTGDLLGKRGMLTSDVNLLEKPFDPSGLLTRVRELMDG